MKKLLWIFLLLPVFSAAQIQLTSTNWSTCIKPTCDPGGAGVATSAPQTFGATSSMTVNGPAYSNALWTYKIMGSTTATQFSAHLPVTIDSFGVTAQTFEYDMFKFAGGVNYMMGMQCNQLETGFWQVWDQLHSAWINTTIACSLPPGAHVIDISHHICGTNMCYDTLTVDGVVNFINMQEPSGPTPPGWTDAYGVQIQLDEGPSGSSLNEVLGTAYFTPTVRSTVSSAILGNAWPASGGLANLEIGKNAGQAIDIRFVPEHVAPLATIRPYIKTGIGYSLGTGGTVKVAAQADDGTANHRASGVDLVTTSFSPGNPTADNFPLTALSVSPALCGAYCHIVFTNTDGSPAANYVSLDDIGNDTLSAGPYYSSALPTLNCGSSSCFDRFAILTKSTASPTWTVKTNHIPIISINYSDGTSQGQGYIDELVSSGLFNIQGANLAGQTFTPGSDTSVSAISAWVKKVGNPGPLSVSLQTAAGSVIETGTIPASTVNSLFTWVTYPLVANRSLGTGATHRVVLSAPSDASNYYQTFPMQDGTCCGFAVPSTYTGGNYQTNTAGTWANYNARTDYDLPLFLQASPIAASGATSGILNPSRVIDWTQAGIPTGIPTRTTVCASLTSGATSAQINAAITACPANQVVSLGAGTYTIAGGITNGGHGSFTLRGAGPLLTRLNFTSGNGCTGPGGDICMISNPASYNGTGNVQPGGTNAANWTAGYAVGTTAITLDKSPPVGQTIILDQASDTTDTGGILICNLGICNGEGNVSAPGRTVGGNVRSQQQIVKVVSVTGSGPYQVVISPGIYAPNWTASKTPGAWWPGYVTGIGIENMTVDHSSSSAASGIYFFNCYACWVKNIRSFNGNRNHIWFYQSAHIVVRDSYFFGTHNGAEQSYGIEPYQTSDDLVENNIFDQISSPDISGTGEGVVWGYNLTTNNTFINPNWMQVSYSAHNTGNMFSLFEGNNMNGLYCDDDWGTSGLMTHFRNRIIGWQANHTLNMQSFRTDWGCRGQSFVGNVLGQPGFQTQYEVSPIGGSTANCDRTIYAFGYRGAQCKGATDPLVRATSMRWGNFDTVHNATQWDAAESAPAAVGSGVNQVPGNTTPASHALPASFYLAAKPSWFGTAPWPAIGPDVAGGTGPGGFSFAIPAETCFNNTSVTGGIKNFDADVCYGAPVTTPRVSGVSMNGVKFQ